MGLEFLMSMRAWRARVSLTPRELTAMRAMVARDYGAALAIKNREHVALFGNLLGKIDRAVERADRKQGGDNERDE